MFRCVRAPREPQFDNTLASFGYHKTDKGEFVSNETGQYFDFFHTDNERVNDIRRGAYQEALRTEIATELKSKHGVTELFLSGEDGTDVTSSRPKGRQHVSLLTTKVIELAEKRDVVVVVGERTQDCGIWAWRVVQRVGGMEGGSLVGLVKKLAARGGEMGERAMAELSLDDKSCVSKEQSETPGIIVLNPGQLLYSHDLDKNVSMPTWQSRPRSTAISVDYKIEPRFNFIPGHESPHKHVQTVFTHVLPNLISSDARLHLLTIGDGSASTIDHLDQHSNMKLGSRTLASIALIEPTHDHDNITSEHLRTFLASSGKSWVQSEEVKGTRLLMPEGTLLGMPALEYAPSARAVSPEREGSFATETAADSAQGSKLLDASREASTQHDDDDDTHENVDDQDGPIDDNSPTPVPPNTPAASLPNSPDPTTQPHTNNISDATQEEQEEEEEYNEDEYPPPPPLPVSCPTYSSGVCDGVAETVFPAVIDNVLEHLWFHIKLARDEEKRESARAEAKGSAWPRDGGEE